MSVMDKTKLAKHETHIGRCTMITDSQATRKKVEYKCAVYIAIRRHIAITLVV